jgi:hypothetical protein
MQFRAAQHEVGGGGADLSAVKQDALVVRGSVLTPHPEAMDRGLGADIVALRAVGDALSHLGGDGVWHDLAPSARCARRQAAMSKQGPHNLCRQLKTYPNWVVAPAGGPGDTLLRGKRHYETGSWNHDEIPRALGITLLAQNDTVGLPGRIFSPCSAVYD